MRNYLKLFIYLIILGFVVGIFYFIYPSIKPHKAAPLLQSGSVVTTSIVHTASLPVKVTSIGTLIPLDKTEISPKQDGYVEKVYFKEGQRVNKGMLLIQLSDTAIRAQLKADENILQTKAKLNTQYSIALKKGLITGVDAERAKTDYETALSNVVQDKIKLQQTKLYASFSGYIGSDNLSVGDYVSAGQKLATIVDKDHLKIVYTLAEKYASQSKLGQTVTVNFSNNRTASGEVTFIAPIIDSDTGTITLHANIKNPNITLTPGEYVSVTQTIGQKQSLVVPEESIVASLQGYHVFTLVNNKAQSTTVSIGSNNFGSVEITKGLKAGDIVIVKGIQNIKDGQTVKVDDQGTS